MLQQDLQRLDFKRTLGFLVTLPSLLLRHSFTPPVPASVFSFKQWQGFFVFQSIVWALFESVLVDCLLYSIYCPPLCFLSSFLWFSSFPSSAFSIFILFLTYILSFTFLCYNNEVEAPVLRNPNLAVLVALPSWPWFFIGISLGVSSTPQSLWD